MIRAERTRQVLRRKHINMIKDRHHLRLRMEVVIRGQLMATCDETESCILNCLETLDRRGLDVGGPNGGCIVHFGPDERFVGDEERLRVLAP